MQTANETGSLRRRFQSIWQALIKVSLIFLMCAVYHLVGQLQGMYKIM